MVGPFGAEMLGAVRGSARFFGSREKRFFPIPRGRPTHPHFFEISSQKSEGESGIGLPSGFSEKPSVFQGLSFLRVRGWSLRDQPTAGDFLRKFPCGEFGRIGVIFPGVLSFG